MVNQHICQGFEGFGYGESTHFQGFQGFSYGESTHLFKGLKGSVMVNQQFQGFHGFSYGESTHLSRV